MHRGITKSNSFYTGSVLEIFPVLFTVPSVSFFLSWWHHCNDRIVKMNLLLWLYEWLDHTGVNPRVTCCAPLNQGNWLQRHVVSLMSDFFKWLAWCVFVNWHFMWFDCRAIDQPGSDWTFWVTFNALALSHWWIIKMHTHAMMTFVFVIFWTRCSALKKGTTICARAQILAWLCIPERMLEFWFPIEKVWLLRSKMCADVIVIQLCVFLPCAIQLVHRKNIWWTGELKHFWWPAAKSWAPCSAATKVQCNIFLCDTPRHRWWLRQNQASQLSIKSPTVDWISCHPDDCKLQQEFRTGTAPRNFVNIHLGWEDHHFEMASFPKMPHNIIQVLDTVAHFSTIVHSSVAHNSSAHAQISSRLPDQNPIPGSCDWRVGCHRS